MLHAARRRTGRPRSRGFLLLLAACLLAGVLAGAALLADGDDTTRREAPSFRFEHPADWRAIRGAELPNDETGLLGRHNFGLGRHDYVGVDAIDTEGAPIDAGNVAQLLPTWEDYHAQFARENGGRLSAPPAVVEVDGLPAIEHEAQLVSAGGVPVIEHVYRVFDGSEGWVISCRVRQDAPVAVRRQIDAGCAIVVESFEPGAES